MSCNIIKKKDILSIRPLDEIQINAINYTLQSDLPVSLIYGPPGTGKSKTIKEIIFQALIQKKKILVTAFSNVGCDNISNIFTSLSEKFLSLYASNNELTRDSLENDIKNKFIRIGRTTKTNKEVMEIALEEKEKNCYWRECLEKIEKSEYTKEDLELISSRKTELENKLNRYRTILIEKADVVFSTCISSGSFIMRKFLNLKKNYFDLIIIDEASQALEASCWIPLLQGKKVIIVGDFNQILPIVNTNTKIIYTMFQRLHDYYKDQISSMLRVQYRMHEKIMKFSSKYFYNNKLIADREIKNRTLFDKLEINRKLSSNVHFDSYDPLGILKEPLILVTTNGNSFEQNMASSKFNAGEAKIAKFFVNYLRNIGLAADNIGIITPYAAQENYLQRELDYSIDTSTVDAFQGSEREVIILSFVRSNYDKSIGFLADKKRINVAITRAKKMLIIICDAQTVMGKSDFMNEMMDYYLKNSKVFTSEEIEAFMKNSN